MRRSSVALIVVVIALLPTPARAYSDWGYDPDEPGGRRSSVSLDVSTTHRDVVGRGADSTMLRITVNVYGETIGYWYTLRVMLDSKAGNGADYLMTIWDGDLTGHSCTVRSLKTGRESEGRFATGDTWGRCRIPVSRVHPNKKIRWSVRSYSNNDTRKVLDRAPDRGWYG